MSRGGRRTTTLLAVVIGLVMVGVGAAFLAVPAAEAFLSTLRGAPAGRATEAGTSAELTVELASPAQGDVNATFHGRVRAGDDKPFSLVVVPDTQYYSVSDTALNGFTAQRDWILANREELNLKAVIHLGDIQQNTDRAGGDSEWARVSPILDSLQRADLPLAITTGNHDYSTLLFDTMSGAEAPLYDAYFPVGDDPRSLTRFEWAGGYMGQPESVIPGTFTDRGWKNNFVLFSAAGMDFIIISVEYDFPYETIDWLDAVLTAFPDRRAIISTHQWLEDEPGAPISIDRGTTGGSAADAWAKIRNRCNVFLILSGHNSGQGGERSRVERNTCGQDVQMQLSDYQGRANAGDGWLRLITFTPDEDVVRATTYSPSLQLWEKDENSNLTWQYPQPDESEWLTVGSAVIPAGERRAAVAWRDLRHATDYEWFVRTGRQGAQDAPPTSIWSFRTAPAPEKPARPVQVLRVSTDADAGVASTAGTNYGGNNQLFSRAGSQESFLRFQVPAAPAGAVLTSATLRLRSSTDASAASADVHAVDVVSGSWSEAGVTWSSRPTTLVANVGSIAGVMGTNQAFTVPLNVAELGGWLGDPVTLRISSSAGTDNLRVWSRESSIASYRPELVLVFSQT